MTVPACPPPARARSSARSRVLSPSLSRAEKTALIIASGAFWPVIDAIARLNSSESKLPSSLISNLENIASALIPFSWIISCSFLSATASNLALICSPNYSLANNGHEYYAGAEVNSHGELSTESNERRAYYFCPYSPSWTGLNPNLSANFDIVEVGHGYSCPR